MVNNAQFQSEFYQPICFEPILDAMQGDYGNGMTKLIKDVFDSIKIILRYTYDHLSNRFYAGQYITTIPAVQSEFSEVLLALDQVNALISERYSAGCVRLILEKMIDVLHRLARLGGARAVLKNNAIELMVNLKLFNKCQEGL